MEQQSFIQLMQFAIFLSVVAGYIWLARLKARKPNVKIGHVAVPLTAISILIAGHFFGVTDGLGSVFGFATAAIANWAVNK
jgi:hypothetical protein